ncbi:uncharacterized protein LOC122404743 [Colletes gigas]|uniref:uncharacterized protein LOC122404743 n=1 Tax=Colletes gigas TaxID=935657 RepID=UPI001C9AB5C2|nr:uncharacterized protein LOC122404743 [Colletes gigas]
MDEPVRKCVLDYIREIRRFKFCRLIFCAKVTNCDDIEQLFDTAIKKKFLERITGLLLIYPGIVIHLVEAVEDDVFRLCNEVSTNNPDVIINAKCLYMQSGAKRFFQKWHSARINNCSSNDKEFETIDDSFENVSSIHTAMILNLHKLYTELWNIRRLKSYENFIEHLDLISRKGHLNVPLESNIEIVLKSRWGYNLMTLAKDYCDLKYQYNFDDYSPVSEIIHDINYTVK